MMARSLRVPGVVSLWLLFGVGLVGCKDEIDGLDGNGFGEEADTDPAMTGGSGVDDPGGGATDGGGDSDPVEPDEEDVPHARGTIVLGESHVLGSGSSTPVVSAGFVPDFDAVAPACTQSVGGCEISQIPDCGDQCGVDEVCTFSDSCQPTCQPICDLACGADEVCYFPIPGSPACKAIESFDAGALTFSGTTVPITLFPPYQFAGDLTGAPFVPGAELSVHASGATDAGFEPFEVSFSATDLLQTELDSLNPDEAYGTGPLPIRWTPGSDDITLSVTVTGSLGSYGTVTCPGDDAAGLLEVPRAAIETAIDPDDTVSGLHVSVQRTRRTLHKGLTTTGKLLEQTVQPEGWVELVSSSVESATLEGCGGLTWCEGACVDTLYDELHCGACGEACAAGEVCSGGVCTGGGGGGGACCVAGAGPGCADPVIENCVCASDPYCCDTTWDGTCAEEVTSLGCGVC